MFVKLLKSKLHMARVTASKLHYPGSIGIDSELMAAAGLSTYEHVLVANVDNGSRLETYAVPAEAGSRKIEILGAAAQLVKAGDMVIVMAFGYYAPDEAGKVKPKVIVLDENNEVVKKSP